MLLSSRHREGRVVGYGTVSLAEIPPTRLFLLSFGLLILVGTLGLLFLPGLYEGAGLGFVDALFTATSAVCVTGLIVVDTATYFTPFGQAWIALLIQLGGLGILTFTTLLIVVLGRRTTLGMEEAAGGQAHVLRHLDGKSLVKAVVISTFLLEALGAVALWLIWSNRFGAAGALWPAIFHAISAFCNAGFSVFSDSLLGFQRAPATLLLISSLIVVGGIGFIVLTDLRARYLSRATQRLGTHTQLVLISTAIFLAAGMLLFLVFESDDQLRDLSWPSRVVNALFMSVTPRTAGFNTVDYDASTNPTLFLTLMLMIVGGSPGSTAGGLKTTTAALLGLALWGRLRGRRLVSVGGRTVPEETVQRASGLAAGGLAFLALAVFLLAMTELPAAETADRTQFLRLVFEAHSAFGTVGLSMGVTPALSTVGRLIVTCVMFVGRVGPLSIASAMAFAEARTKVKYRFPYEDVVIG
jgi:trk system potassium uptake protein TrkH